MYSAETWLDIVIQGIAPEISVWSRRHVGYRILCNEPAIIAKN